MGFPEQRFFVMGCNAIVPRAGNAGKIGLVRPCGRCIECRLNYKRGKAIRAVHELEFWDTSSFVSLTYDDDNLVYNPTAIAPSVSRRDLQLFWKQLRSKLSPLKISYMASAEYGDTTERPHYHAIIYGWDFPDREYWKTDGGNKLYTSQLLSEAWGFKGHAVIGDVTYDSSAYVANYTVKKLSGEPAKDMYDDCGRLPPFGAMSVKPAIGRRWIEKYLYDVYPRDTIVVNGKEVRPPRYYDEYLKKVDEPLWKKVEVSRREAAKKRLDENYVASGAVKGICQESKILQKSAKI